MFKKKALKLTLSGFLFLTSTALPIAAQDAEVKETVNVEDIVETEINDVIEEKEDVIEQPVEVVDEVIDEDVIIEETEVVDEVQKLSGTSRAITTGVNNDITWTFDDQTRTLTLSGGTLIKPSYNATLAETLGLDPTDIRVIEFDGPFKIQFNYSNHLFENFVRLEKIVGLDQFDYSNLSDITSMFKNTPHLEEIDMTWPGFEPWGAANAFQNTGAKYIHGTETWSAINLRWADRMFDTTPNLERLDLNWGTTSNLWTSHAMFNGSGVKEIKGTENFSFRDTTSMTFMFANTPNLEYLDMGVKRPPTSTTSLDAFFSESGVKEIRNIDGLYSPNVTNIIGMFDGTVNLKTMSVPWLEGPNAMTDVTYLFAGSGIETVENIETWDLTSIDTVQGMFLETPNLKSVNLDWGTTTANLENVWVMFEQSGVEEVLNLDMWDTSSLLHVSSMFEGTTRLQEVHLGWTNTATIEDYDSMFRESSVKKVTGLKDFTIQNNAYVRAMFKDSAIRDLELPTNFLGTIDQGTGFNIFEGANELRTLRINDVNLGVNFLLYTGLVHRDDLKYTGRWYTEHTTPIEYDSTQQMIDDAYNQAGVYQREFHDYSVTYDSNGGNTNIPADKFDWHMDDVVTVDFLKTPEKTGYTFVGWTDGTKEYTSTESFVMPGENVVLTAVYKANDYAVEVVIDGVTTSLGDLAYGSLIPEPATPEKVGHTFAGWYKDSAFTDKWDFTSDTVNGVITLYAKFDINSYVVEFTVDGTVVDTQTIEYGSKLAPIATPKREGYAFRGWYKDAAYTTLWNFEEDVVEDVVTLYSKWEKLDRPIVDPDGDKEDGKTDGDKTKDKDKTPKTGIYQQTALYGGLVVVGIFVLNLALFRRKRQK